MQDLSSNQNSDKTILDTNSEKHRVAEDIKELAKSYADPYTKSNKEFYEAVYREAGTQVLKHELAWVDKLNQHLISLSESSKNRRQKAMTWKTLKQNCDGLDISDIEPDIDAVHESLKSSARITGSLVVYKTMAGLLVVLAVFGFFYRQKSLESQRTFMENYWFTSGKLLSCNYVKEARVGSAIEVEACQRELNRLWFLFQRGKH